MQTWAEAVIKEKTGFTGFGDDTAVQWSRKEDLQKIEFNGETGLLEKKLGKVEVEKLSFFGKK